MNGVRQRARGAIMIMPIIALIAGLAIGSAGAKEYRFPRSNRSAKSDATFTMRARLYQALSHAPTWRTWPLVIPSRQKGCAA